MFFTRSRSWNDSNSFNDECFAINDKLSEHYCIMSTELKNCLTSFKLITKMFSLNESFGTDIPFLKESYYRQRLHL